MVDKTVVTREFNEERDRKMVGKLERRCGKMKEFDKGVSIFTNMMGKGDPLCRIRLFPLHVMLVAEMQENGELVGVVRGCIKCVGTKLGASNVKLGCILGLRVSPDHRRIGIGSKLMKSVEEWMARNGANYTFLATEKSNMASTNLFTIKCNYVHLSSLVIFVKAISPNTIPQSLSPDIKVEKLHVEQAIHLYNIKLKDKDMYPADIDSILKEKMNLGTWVIYFKEEKWDICSQHKDNTVGESPSSWIMFSIWSSCEANNFKIRIRHQPHMKFIHTALGNARDKMFSCLKFPNILENKRFGYLSLYGIHGVGDRVGELLKSAWGFASRLAKTIKDCKAVVTEMGTTDPLMQYLAPQEFPGISCIDDLWYIKKLSSLPVEEDLKAIEEIGNVFVDPRDF